MILCKVNKIITSIDLIGNGILCIAFKGCDGRGATATSNIEDNFAGNQLRVLKQIPK